MGDNAADVNLQKGGTRSKLAEAKSMGDVVIDVDEQKGARPATDVDLSGLTPGACDGASGFLIMTTLCCSLFVALPVVMLVVLDDLFIVAIVLFAVGFLIIMFSLRRTFIDGVCCVPPASHPKPAFMQQDTGDRQHYTVDVKKLYVIVNPHSGVNRGPKILKEVKKVWEDKGIQVTVLETKYAGHERDYAATVDLNGYDALCIIGGDGSFSNVCNGMLSRADDNQVPIGLIPGGSGNSVSEMLGTLDSTEMAKRVTAGDVCWMDAVHMEDEAGMNLWSVNEVSWGLVGDVGVVAEDYRCFGPARYDICAIWGVFKKLLAGATMKFRADSGGDVEEIGGEYLTMFVNTTVNFGKGMHAAPDAVLDDGLMDFMSLKDASRGELLAIFLQLPKGQHNHNPNLLKRQVKEVVFSPERRRGVLNVDGETVPYTGTITMKCVHKKLRIFAPPDVAHT